MPRRLVVSAVFMFAVLVTAPAATAAVFGPATATLVGAGPSGVALGDFNGDGVADLVTANTLSGDTSVLLGRSTGGYEPAVTAVSGAANDVAVGDLNGDGDPDLALADVGSGGVLLRYGGPAATFDAPTSPSGATLPGGTEVVRIADLSNDGKPDVVGGSGRVVQYLYNDIGGFPWLEVFQETLPQDGVITDLATGDFDGDLDIDHAAADNHEGVVRLFEREDATTAVVRDDIAAGPSPRRLVAGDFDDDADPDLAVIGSTAAVHVLEGQNGLGFDDPVAVPLQAVPLAIAVGDITGDGDLDLLVGQPTSVVLLQGGRGSTFVNAGAFPVDATPAAIALGRLDGDDRLDAAVATFGSPVNVLLNTYAPGIHTEAASLAFGAQTVGTVGGARTMTITSTGDVPLRPTAVRTVGAARDDFLVIADTCSRAAVAPGGTCSVTLRFAPTAPGRRTASLQILGAAPATVALSGTGTSRVAPAERRILASTFATDRLTGRRGKRVRVRFVSTLAGTATLELRRGTRVVRRVSDTVVAGRNTVTIRAPRKRGRYVLALTVSGGGQTATDSARLTVMRRPA